MAAARAGASDQLGSIAWTERTGGVLTARECVTLAGPLLREEVGILAGLLAIRRGVARGSHQRGQGVGSAHAPSASPK